MKKFSIVLIAFFVFQSICAQEENGNLGRNEFMVGSTNMFSLYSTTMGVGYKRHFDKFSLRTSIYTRYVSRNQLYSTNPYKSVSQTYTPRVGFEINKTSYPINMYYGVDFGVGFSRTSYRDYLRPDLELLDENFRNIDGYISYGIFPLIGVRFHLTPMVIISTETSLNFVYTEKYSGRDVSKWKMYEAETKVYVSPIGKIMIGVRL